MFTSAERAIAELTLVFLLGGRRSLTRRDGRSSGVRRGSHSGRRHGAVANTSDGGNIGSARPRANLSLRSEMVRRCCRYNSFPSRCGCGCGCGFGLGMNDILGKGAVCLHEV